ncbi:hypothetical protein NIES22_66120 [Calothrix brevissima NIES-22]|nr:hypothetical protein NIES22_66120 [Calothrix brevissima NIES-22]
MLDEVDSSGDFTILLPQGFSTEMPMMASTHDETQCHQLKSHEMKGQMFDNEYDERDCRNGWDENS